MSQRTPCPLILVHECRDAPVPIHRFVAGFYIPTYTGSAERGDREQVGWKRLPMTFNGYSAVNVRMKAEEWWEAEQDREERKRAAAAAAGARMRNRRAA